MATDPGTIQDQIATFVDQMKVLTLEATDRLEDYSSLPFLTWVDFAPKAGISLNLPANITSTNDLPTLEKAELNYDLTGYDPNQYKRPIFLSDFFDTVLAELTSQIENGGPGISSAVQDALWDNMRERDLQTLRDMLIEAESNVGRRGFPMPTAMSQGARAKVIAQYQDTRDNRNREITFKVAELAQQNMQVAVSSGTAIERANMDFSAGFAKVFVDIGNQILTKFRAEQEARVAEFDGQLRTILAKLQVQEINARVQGQANEQLLKQWEVESAHAIEKTKALIVQGEHAAKARLEAGMSLADVYKGMAIGALSQINSIVSVSTTSDQTTTP